MIGSFKKRGHPFFFKRPTVKAPPNSLESNLLLPDGTKIHIPIRSDGMVNLTALSKAVKHRLDNYMASNETKAYVRALKQRHQDNPDFKGCTWTEATKGQGTWAHRLIVYHYAQKLSPQFAVQVSCWLDNLFMTGKVTLGKEIDQAELDAKWMKKLELLDSENKDLSMTIETQKTKIAEQQYELDNFMTVRYLARDQKVIDGFNMVFGKRQLDRRVDKYIFYVLYIGKRIVDGAERHTFKFGISENCSGRMTTHRASFGDIMRIVLIQKVSFGTLVERKVKKYLKKNNAMCEILDLNNRVQKECFATRSDFELEHALLYFMQVCEKMLEPGRLQLINNDLERDIVELKREHERDTRELKTLNDVLSLYTKSCRASEIESLC